CAIAQSVHRFTSADRSSKHRPRQTPRPAVIVVDTNVIAYCWIDGERTAVAQRVRSRDPEWHAPFLWRSELRSALVATLWRRAMKTEDASSIMTEVENALTGREHLVASDAVLELAVATHLSAYDCE